MPFMLTVRGKPNAPSIEAARSVHNATAGAPPSVAGARSLGDLSHNVYAGRGDAEGEILFVNVWNSLGGLGQFFSNPQVQESAGQLFASRDAVVWRPAEGYGNFHLALPAGQAVGAVGILRVTLGSVEKAAAAFGNYAAATVNQSRAYGLVSHSVWLRADGPGETSSAEAFGLDLWADADRMDQFYELGAGFEHLGPVFAGTPQTATWRPAPGEWVEW